MPTVGKSPVMPTMRYRDAPPAIDWLCRVLGFSRHLNVGISVAGGDAEVTEPGGEAPPAALRPSGVLQ